MMHPAACSHGLEKRQTTIAAEGNEVQVAESIDALEALGHEEKPHARKPSDGAPTRTNSSVMCRDAIMLGEMPLRKSIAKAWATRQSSPLPRNGCGFFSGSRLLSSVQSRFRDREDTMSSITQRFNEIRWHDSKLLGLCFYRKNSQEMVKISLQLLGDQGALMPVEMVFKESTYIQLDVDLEGKSQCSDDISEANCSAESDWLLRLSAGNPYDNFKGFLHFKIRLVPPGGEINILAKDFALASAASP